MTFDVSADVEQLGLILERLPIGILVVGRSPQNVVFANQAAIRFFHPTRVRQRSPVPEPWPSFSLQGYVRRLAERGVVGEQRVEVDDDHVYLVRGFAIAGSKSAVILIEDISTRARRLRAEREFVANAAHELLTPLTGIVGAAHVLEAGAKEVPEDRDQFIAHISRECTRLTRIARSLLVLARAQSGEEPPRLEILQLCGLLDEVAAQLGMEVTVRCDDALTVLADEDLFVQAATNLISNAIRHGPDAKAVVEAREVAANLVQIDVTDAGHRVPDARLFRRRFRSGAGRDGGGFGLGLSIAAQSLEAMGGHLFLDGDAARIELPRGDVR